MPSCSRLAPLPTPVHYVVGHRVRVREHCSRLSCIQSGLPTGRLDRDRPSRTSDHGRLGSVCTSFRTEAVRVAPRTMAEVTELVRQAVEPRLTIESFPSRPPAPQRRRRSRFSTDQWTTVSLVEASMVNSAQSSINIQLCSDSANERGTTTLR